MLRKLITTFSLKLGFWKPKYWYWIFMVHYHEKWFYKMWQIFLFAISFSPLGSSHQQAKQTDFWQGQIDCLQTEKTNLGHPHIHHHYKLCLPNWRFTVKKNDILRKNAFDMCYSWVDMNIWNGIKKPLRDYLRLFSTKYRIGYMPK